MNFRKKKKEKKPKALKKPNILSKLLTTLCCCFALTKPSGEEEKDEQVQPDKKGDKSPEPACRQEKVPEARRPSFDVRFDVTDGNLNPPIKRRRSESNINNLSSSSKTSAKSDSASNINLARSRPSFLWPIRSIVRASYHQASYRFLDSPFLGSQCTIMAVTAVTMSVIKPVATWSRSLLDKMLRQGDRNHNSVMASLGRTGFDNPRIALREIESKPVLIRLGRKPYTMLSSVASQAWGDISAAGEPDPVMSWESGKVPLDVGLQRSLEDMDGAVFTVGEFSMAVLKDSENGSYWMWDSHSRNVFGMSVGNGTANLQEFDSLADLMALVRSQLQDEGQAQSTFESQGFKLVG